MITVERFDAPYCDACKGTEQPRVVVRITARVRGREVQTHLCAEHAKWCEAGLHMLRDDGPDPAENLDDEFDDDYEIDCGGDDCDRT